MNKTILISAVGQPGQRKASNFASRTETAGSVMQGTVRGTAETHNLGERGATPRPATTPGGGRLFAAAGATGERKATDTNFAARRPAAARFMGEDQTAGRAGASGFPRVASHYGARLDGRALPSRTGLAQFVYWWGGTRIRSQAQAGAIPAPTTFSRLRNAVAAPELAGSSNSLLPHNKEQTTFDSVVRLPPVPARFFVEPRPGYVLTPAPRRRLAENCRGLRLVWLLTLSGGVR
jgi:hypothetical protein